MTLECFSNCGECRLIESEKKFRKWGREEFIEDEFESWVRNFFETERRFTHLADSGAESGDVFGAKPSLMTPSHF
jgi:hypothetical protein